MAQLRLGKAYVFLRRHGLADEAQALAQSDDRLPGVSEAQLKRAKLLHLLEEHQLLEEFLTQEWPKGDDKTLRLHLSRLRGVRARMESYDGPRLTTRSLREAERAQWKEASAQRAAASTTRKSGMSGGTAVVLVALGLVFFVMLVARQDDSPVSPDKPSSSDVNPCRYQFGEEGKKATKVYYGSDGKVYDVKPPPDVRVTKILTVCGDGHIADVDSYP